MTLRVPYEGFVEAVRRSMSVHDAYVYSDNARVILSAGQGDKKMVIVSSTTIPIEEVTKTLKAAGLHVYEGLWSIGDDFEMHELPYVGAVSYRANRDHTGVWVEAYPNEPTKARVLQDLFEEFKNSGDVGDLTFDQFESSVQASVVVLSPSQIETFLTNKRLQGV